MSLTRTQICLSEPQRRFLQRRARQEGQSVAAVLRSLIDREIQSAACAEDPFFDLKGIIRSGGAVRSDQLDEHLYKPDWDNRPST
jgi:hypothetical protein